MARVEDLFRRVERLEDEGSDLNARLARIEAKLNGILFVVGASLVGGIAFVTYMAEHLVKAP